MHLPQLVTDLAVMLLTAGIITLIFRKLNLPLVLGYILAGFLIGPYMPLFFTVADSASISAWSEIGIIILMFALGLEFNLHKLAEVGMTGTITALTEVGGMLLLGYLAGQLMGWSTMDCVFLGGMLSMSSTTIIIKAFDELGLGRESFADLVFGTLIIEDIAGIFMMIILSTVSVSQDVSGGALAGKLGLLVVYLAVWLLAGIYLLPTVLKKASGLMSDEMLLITALGTCFGMVLLADTLGFSSALGAFLAGSLMAGTVHAERIEHLTKSVKDLFGSVFFLSVGMMLDPAMVVKYIGPILIISCVTIAGKLLFSSLGVIFSGNSLKNAVHCGCSLAQIGEFAFIIASLGLSLGVVTDYVYPIIVSVSVITTLTTPFFIKKADKIYKIIERLLPSGLVEKLNRTSGEENEASRSDWSVFLRRYTKRTALFGVIMLAIVILGINMLYPAVSGFIEVTWLARAISIAGIYFLLAFFVRPILDLHSSEFTVLWIRKANRLPLIALTGLRLLAVVFLFFLPLRYIVGAGSLWLLPVLACAVLLLSRSGWFASGYLQAEAHFLANLNERLLENSSLSDTALLLDEELYTADFDYEGETASLSSLNWGKRYGINIIRIQSGKKCKNMPSAEDRLSSGDRLLILGQKDAVSALLLAENRTASPMTLRAFTERQPGNAESIYTFVLPVDKTSPICGRTIRDCGIRDNYDCMILGLQRGRLPIVNPDVNTTLSAGDLVWIMGSRHMADLLLAKA